MSEINVISRTQTIIVDPSSGSVAIVNAGPQGPAGPQSSPITFTHPANGVTRNSNVLGPLSTPWTSSINTTPSLPNVKYDLRISAQVGSDTLIYFALVRNGIIIDRGTAYIGGADRELPCHICGIDDPGIGAIVYEVYVASHTATLLTVSSVVNISTAVSLTADGVSSLQLQAVSID